jgi:hypothetical protein
MAVTQKIPSDLDYSQNIQNAYNDVDATLSTNGFLMGKVGRKVIVTVSTTTITSDTETYAFSENAVALYSLKLIYTDGTRSVLISAERIS